MLKLKIKVNPFFFIYLAFLVAVDSTAYMLIIILSALFHELAHLYVMNKKGVLIKELCFSPLGIRIIPKHPISYKDEVLVSLAGPLVNLTLFLILWLLSFKVKLPYRLGQLAVCNFILGFGNLIPLLPLDGGRILRGILYKYCPSKANFLIRLLGLMFSLSFLVLGFVAIFETGFNISLILIGIYLSVGFAVEIKKDVENV